MYMWGGEGVFFLLMSSLLKDVCWSDCQDKGWSSVYQIADVMFKISSLPLIFSKFVSHNCFGFRFSYLFHRY